MKIIPAGDDKKYWDEILKIRNENCFGFGNNKPINKKDHYCFMEKNYYDYFVYLDEVQNNTVAGFVGCVNNDIRIAIKNEYKRLGLAKDLIYFIKKKYPNSFAKVKSDNIPSLKLFESCGFKKTWYVLEKIND